MIRSKARFKQYAALGFVSVALVSAACSDDEDGVDGNTGGGGSSAGKATGGTNTSGSPAGGKASAGTAGMPSAGTQSAAGSDGEGGSAPEGGATGQGGAPDAAGATGEGGAVAGGAGGSPSGSEGGADGDGGAGGEAAFVADVLDNPGWETGTAHVDMPGWTNEGTPGAAYIEYSNPHDGFGRMGHWTMWVDANSPPYTARTFQTLDPIANGTYSFSVWVDRNYAEDQYLFARDFNADDANDELTQDTDAAEAEPGYFKITLTGIQVTSGKCTVGIYTANPAGTYANFDDAEFTPE